VPIKTIKIPLKKFLLLISHLCILTSLADYAELPLASGFDFPVGAPTGTGYYKARGFWPNGHVGEDWNGKGGGNTDLGDPVYSIGDGIVVQSRDVRRGWGNVIIIRHVFMDKNSTVKLMDSLYAHLDSRNVVLNQIVKRGQRIGAIGNNRGMYLAHLHFETRKNLSIGMHRSSFAKTYSNYYSPTSFIRSHRNCKKNNKSYKVPINTFAPYPGTYTKIKNQNMVAKNVTPKPEIKSNKNSKPEQNDQPNKKSILSTLDPKIRGMILKKPKKEPVVKTQPKQEKLSLLARIRARYTSSKDGTRKKNRSRFSPRKRP
tara:strand:+ start:2346 stop:3290 length:945 start_codon:yes stop_codon:yes gene_type:complete